MRDFPHLVGKQARTSSSNSVISSLSVAKILSCLAYATPLASPTFQGDVSNNKACCAFNITSVYFHSLAKASFESRSSSAVRQPINTLEGVPFIVWRHGFAPTHFPPRVLSHGGKAGIGTYNHNATIYIARTRCVTTPMYGLPPRGNSAVFAGKDLLKSACKIGP